MGSKGFYWAGAAAGASAGGAAGASAGGGGTGTVSMVVSSTVASGVAGSVGVASRLGRKTPTRAKLMPKAIAAITTIPSREIQRLLSRTEG